MSDKITDHRGQPFSRTNPLEVSAQPFITDLLALTLDTSQYAAGDVLADVLELQLPDARPCVLHEVYVLDEDDQGAAFDLLILNARIVGLAAKNSAWNASDIEMRKQGRRVAVTAGDYLDLGGNRVADVSGLGRFVIPDGSGKLYVHSISQGTATYTVNGLRLSFGFLR